MGSRDGIVVRALTSHQCVPGWIPGPGVICGLSLLLVHYSAPRGFSPGTPVFPSPQKPTFPKSNSARNQVDKKPLCGCATCKSLFIYLACVASVSGSSYSGSCGESKNQPESSPGLIYYIDTSVLLENIPLVKFIKSTSGTRVVYFP